MIEYKDIKKGDNLELSLDGYYTKLIGKVIDKITGDLGSKLIIVRLETDHSIQIIDYEEWGKHYIIERGDAYDD